jgi:hypothetical protein
MRHGFEHHDKHEDSDHEDNLEDKYDKLEADAQKLI